MTDPTRRIPEDFKSDDTDKRSQSEKLHAHWRAKFSADLRATVTERAMDNQEAPMLIAQESDTDKALGYHYHDMDKSSNSKNFDQKIYMFPPAYNALRKELFENWPALWALVGWYMANRPEEFCSIMNGATDLRVIFDSGAVNWMCEKWLNKLISMRMAATRGV